MSTMVAYCRVAVDHFLKMWKSLTPKSLYREDVNPVNLRSEARFAIELCFGAISIRNRGRACSALTALAGSDAFPKRTHLEEASRDLLDARFSKADSCYKFALRDFY